MTYIAEKGGFVVEPTLRNFGERIGALEALMQTMLVGQQRLEDQIAKRFDKFECKYDDRLAKISEELNNQAMEDSVTYKKLKYRIVEYLVIAALSAIVATIAVST